jgi:DegV family protein with EDD domain
MARIQIVTDSACDLPKEIIRSAGIEIAPLPVTFGEQTYKDMVDIDREQFYSMLVKSSTLPQTSQPTPQDYLEIYRRSLDQNDEILVIALSSGLSGTYESATLAKGMLEEEQQKRITIFDSMAASVGQGLIALEAHQRAKAGEDRAAILKTLENLRTRTASIFTLDTLSYLEKGGRIGKVQAMMGTVLNVKPILQLDSMGRIVQKEKVRGRSQAIARLLDIISEEGNHLERQLVGVSHAHSRLEAQRFAEEIRNRFLVRDVVIGEISATIGTHVGPGCLAVFFQR